MKKQFPTVIDESCLSFEAIIFSAGKIGAQVAIAPSALPALTGGSTAAVTVQNGEGPHE